MAQWIAAPNYISNCGIVKPLNSLNFRANFNIKYSSLAIIRSNPSMFSVQCASGVFPSIIEGAKELFSGFAKLIKPRRKFKSRYDFWDYVTYRENSRREASQFAIDEYNRREDKALHLDRILKTNCRDHMGLLYYFELEATDEGSHRSVYNAVVHYNRFEGKNELLAFSEVQH